MELIGLLVMAVMSALIIGAIIFVGLYGLFNMVKVLAVSAVVLTGVGALVGLTGTLIG